jgi:hypothetical protein
MPIRTGSPFPVRLLPPHPRVHQRNGLPIAARSHQQRHVRFPCRSTSISNNKGCESRARFKRARVVGWDNRHDKNTVPKNMKVYYQVEKYETTFFLEIALLLLYLQEDELKLRN